MYTTLENANQIYTILSKFTEQTMNIKLSYKIMKIMAAIELELQFYREKMQNLIETYGDKDEQGELIRSENGDSIKLKEETMEEYYTKAKELLTFEIELPDYSFTLEELEDLQLSPKDLYILDELIEEPEFEAFDEDRDE